MILLDAESIPIKLGCLTFAIFIRFLTAFRRNMSNKRALVNSSGLNEGKDNSTTVVGGSGSVDGTTIKIFPASFSGACSALSHMLT